MNTPTVLIARTIDRSAVQQRPGRCPASPPSRKRDGDLGAGGVGSERRVLVVTYLFPPVMEMGAQACAQIARYLPLYGWTPVVLTVQERYLETIDPRADRAFPGPVIRTRVLTHPFVVYRRLKAWLAVAGNGTTGKGAALKPGPLHRTRPTCVDESRPSVGLRFTPRLGRSRDPIAPGRSLAGRAVRGLAVLARNVTVSYTLPRASTAGAAKQTRQSSTRGLRSWVLSLLAVPDAYTGWIPPAIIRGLVTIRRHRVDHLFSSGPPWTGHLVGLALARLTGLPWTAHFRDPWAGPENEMRRLKPVTTLSLRLEAALERAVVRRATSVVCVTDQHLGLLRRRHPDVPPGKFVTIPNGFDGREWESLDAGTAGQPADTQFVISYAGTLYNRRSPLPLFRALRRLIDAGEVAPERIRIDLVGRCDRAGDRELRELVEECGLVNQVRVAGPLSRSDALRQMVRSSLLLLLAEGLTLQVPGKTYEYLRAGRPILALAPDGAVAQLLRTTGGAWMADPGDEGRIADALREAYRAWDSGRALPVPDWGRVSSFDRRVLAGRFAELFDVADRTK